MSANNNFTRLLTFIHFPLPLVGCAPKPAPVAPAPPAFDHLPVTITHKQRTSAFVAGTKDKAQLTVDDITRGQVMASLAHTESGPLVPTTSFRVNDSRSFKVGEPGPEQAVNRASLPISAAWSIVKVVLNELPAPR